MAVWLLAAAAAAAAAVMMMMIIIMIINYTYLILKFVVKFCIVKSLIKFFKTNMSSVGRLFRRTCLLH
jgi:hypothetical protein